MMIRLEPGPPLNEVSHLNDLAAVFVNSTHIRDSFAPATYRR